VKPTILTLLFATFWLAAPALAGDSLEMEGTSIIGNRELPKVLYIVPWERSELGASPEAPLGGLLDEALVPLDREVFRRRLRYHQAIGEAAGDATPR